MSSKNQTNQAKTETKKVEAKETKRVEDIDIKNVSYQDLEYPTLDVLRDTCEQALRTKVSPIIDFSKRSYPMKKTKGNKKGGKIYEFTLVLLGIDGTLYKMGGEGIDKEIGPGLQGGVKKPEDRQYGRTDIMFKTKTNGLLGEALNLMCQTLIMDTKQKIENKMIKTKNSSITNPIRDEIETGDEESKKAYAESGDYMCRMKIYLRGPNAVRLYGEKFVEEPVDKDRDEKVEGGYLHTYRIDIDDDNAHTQLTYGMGLEHFQFGVDRKLHGFGNSFDIYLATAYPIPRAITFNTAPPKSKKRSNKARLEFAKKAAERAKIAQANAEALASRSSKKESSKKDKRSKKKRSKKDKKEPVPEPSGSDDDFSDSSDNGSDNSGNESD